MLVDSKQRNRLMNYPCPSHVIWRSRECCAKSYHGKVLSRDIILNSDPKRLAFLKSQYRAWTGTIDYQDIFLRHARLFPALFGDSENSIWNKCVIVSYCFRHPEQPRHGDRYKLEGCFEEVHLQTSYKRDTLSGIEQMENIVRKTSWFIDWDKRNPLSPYTWL